MPTIAVQRIASRFGVFVPGQEVPAELVPGSVLDQWRVVGIVEDQEDEVVAEKPKPAAPIEHATRRAPETTTSRRQQPPAESPHRRFVPDNSKDETPHRRFVEDAG
jgi:hypothetical protein